MVTFHYSWVPIFLLFVPCFFKNIKTVCSYYYAVPKKHKLSESGCDPQNDEHKNNFEDGKSFLTECKIIINQFNLCRLCVHVCVCVSVCLSVCFSCMGPSACQVL